MRQEIFRMERVTCKEGETLQLQDVCFQIYEGEILGLLLVYYHGKSTLLDLMQTNLPLYDGYVYYNGVMVNSWKRSSRQHNRISIIRAESSLVGSMSITDNIFVLRQGFRQEIIRTKLLDQQLQPFLEDIGIDIPMDAPVEELTVFERIVVELLRAVVAGHHLIVVDDIGPLLNLGELEKLHAIIRHYAAQGHSFLYTGVHMEEIAQISDRAAFFTNGRIQKIFRREEMQEEVRRVYLEEYDRMVRYHLKHRVTELRTKREPVLRWRERIVAQQGAARFDVCAGECLLIQIEAERQLEKMVGIVTGECGLETGEVQMEGKDVMFPRDLRVGVIQEFPTKSMIFPELSCMENLCFPIAQRMPSIWLRRGIRESIRQEYGELLGDEMFDLPMEELSEKQKCRLVYARVLLQNPKVVFAIHPFKGLDVDHRMLVWKMLKMLLDKGIAVVILSTGLTDALSLADRLLVMDESGSVKELAREDFSQVPPQTPWKHIYKEFYDHTNYEEE